MIVGAGLGSSVPASGNRGKSLGNVIEFQNKQKYRYKDHEKFAGAIKKEKHVLALDRKMEWKLAQIIEVRNEVTHDEDAAFFDIEDATQPTQETPQQAISSVTQADPVHGGELVEDPEVEVGAVLTKAKKPVEYYVHYLEEERPMDRWVKEHMVRINDELVDDLIEEFKKKEEERKREREQSNFLAHDEHHGMNEEELRNFLGATKLKTVEFIQFGNVTMEAWYHSDFPPEYHGRVLYICPFCLFFFKKKSELETHSERCDVRCPPGDEIYRDDKVSMFEFDAKQQSVYTENLCYIAKLFLDHKNIWYEIDAFYFYVLCERKDDGWHMVGYFSKEKESDNNFNLSCIMVLPEWQSVGYGKFLIDFSYQLSLIEGKKGSPEKPLSYFGHRAYVSYWTNRVLNLLLENGNSQLSIETIARRTAILPVDIQYVLESFGVLRCQNNRYYLYTEPEFLKKILAVKGRSFREVQVDKIHWVPHNQH